MSKKTDMFEKKLAISLQNIFQNDTNYHNIPNWFIQEFGTPPYNLNKVEVTGGQLGKTDVLVDFVGKPSLQISVKMANADYWGNWYSHTRFINEFGIDSFNKIVEDCTNWANSWITDANASFFIGVSVSFGKRQGTTGRPLGNILNVQDVISIIQGNFSNPKLNANATYISDALPNNLLELFRYLEPITPEVIINSGILQDMKIIYRPVNPITSGTDRGKCIYTKFESNQVFNEPTVISTLSELQQIGQFVRVTDDSVNHNRQIKYLLDTYNVVIPVKQ